MSPSDPIGSSANFTPNLLLARFSYDVFQFQILQQMEIGHTFSVNLPLWLVDLRKWEGYSLLYTVLISIRWKMTWREQLSVILDVGYSCPSLIILYYCIPFRLGFHLVTSFPFIESHSTRRNPIFSCRNHSHNHKFMHYNKITVPCTFSSCCWLNLSLGTFISIHSAIDTILYITTGSPGSCHESLSLHRKSFPNNKK